MDELTSENLDETLDELIEMGYLNESKNGKLFFTQSQQTSPAENNLAGCNPARRLRNKSHYR